MVYKHHNHNNYFISVILIISAIHMSTLASAHSIYGYDGFVESSSSLIKLRKATNSKFNTLILRFYAQGQDYKNSLVG
uniref:Nodal modulator 1 n=1 Tax=Tanacetum cinerariifolium TaxID=118510 RepID=A0A6L2MZZ2_TANCI|nr:nodal modulator 1 [Tanacetum cinerariifolium]